MLPALPPLCPPNVAGDDLEHRREARTLAVSADTESRLDCLSDDILGLILDRIGPQATVNLGLTSQAMAERTIRLRPAAAGKVLALRLAATPAPFIGQLLCAPWGQIALAKQHTITLAHKGLRPSHAEAIFSALAASEELRQLRMVDCGFQVDRVMSALQRSALPERLEALELCHCRITSDLLDRLLSASPWQRLNRLDLADNELGAAGLDPIYRASHLSGLTYLSIADNGISGVDFRSLARAHHLEGLLDLNIAGNMLGERGLRILGVITWWSTLTRLCLTPSSYNDSENASFSLRWALRLSSLRALEIEDPLIDQSTGRRRLMSQLRDASQLERLTSLRLNTFLSWGEEV